MSTVIEEAFQKAGGREALRKALGVSKQTLSDWKRWGHVSAARAVAVERITGIPRKQLCPGFDWGDAPELQKKPRKPAKVD
jgi:DNA-binding transcriptional regulator YdaS (Cro superfamily)